MGSGRKGNQEEFKAGRPKGPPPGIMGISNSLDTNGDGIVDIQEAMEGMKSIMQQYQNQMTSEIREDGKNDSELNFLA